MIRQSHNPGKLHRFEPISKFAELTRRGSLCTGRRGRRTKQLPVFRREPPRFSGWNRGKKPDLRRWVLFFASKERPGICKNPLNTFFIYVRAGVCLASRVERRPACGGRMTEKNR